MSLFGRAQDGRGQIARYGTLGTFMGQHMGLIPNTSLADGESIGVRIYVGSNQKLVVNSMGVQNDNGNTPSGLTVEVFDDTNNTSVAEFNSNREDDSVVAEVSGGANVVLRINNASGSSQVASAFFDLEVV